MQATIAVPCMITYLALLLWAVFGGCGIGGPLVYPAGLLFLFVAAMVASLVLLLPSTALAEWFARRRGLRIGVQISISVGILAVFCFVLVADEASTGATSSFQDVSLGLGVLFIAHVREMITFEPGKRRGKPCIRHMRITVYDILGWLAAGMTTDEILADDPELTKQDVQASLASAADRDPHLVVGVA
jgi:uncharacterized protein (DUF433 family)